MQQSLQDVKVLLLDIEGTVCPISFVKDTLFPYALKALPKVLEENWTSPDFAVYKSAFPASAQQSPQAFLTHVEDLTTRDVKIAYLKNLQGYLWESGYKTAAYSTPLFDDIAAIFGDLSDTQTSSAKDRRIAIYSSGSIFAQKLLFAHSRWSDGRVVDLTSQIAAYFDTTTAGLKTHKESYEKIARALGEDARVHEILFLSDNVLEVQAALDAGMLAVVVERPGNAPLSDDDRAQFDVITSFDQLSL